MLEVVFSESAAGSLKQAQSYGKGTYRPASIGMILSGTDREASKAEKKAIQRRLEEEERLKWEQAVPMGGKVADIFYFPLVHSVGDISGNAMGAERVKTLEQLFGSYPSGEGAATAKLIVQRASESLALLQQRLSEGESLRIWYSEQADELCGLFWLMAQVSQWESAPAIDLVELPGRELREDAVVTHSAGWGEIAPGDWQPYISLQKRAEPAFIPAAASRWRELQRENAPLRAVINGRLQSVPASFYDPFLLCEIAAQSDPFHEAKLIGKILGKYHLGIGDGWLAMRIEAMIESGQLAAVTAAGPGDPSYCRLLKKTISFG